MTVTFRTGAVAGGLLSALAPLVIALPVAHAAYHLSLLYTGLPNIATLFGERFGLAAVLALLCLRALLAWWYQRRIGGYTGDCLGMAQQLSEILIYLLALAWI